MSVNKQRQIQFGYWLISGSSENDVLILHLANVENKRPCTYIVSYRKWERFLPCLFSFVIALHFIEISPQYVLLKLVFL